MVRRKVLPRLIYINREFRAPSIIFVLWISAIVRLLDSAAAHEPMLDLG